MTRGLRIALLTAASALALLALAATSSSQSYFPEPTAPAYRTVLPGSGGTLPANTVGTYASPRADSPDHLLTVTPFGLASTLCRGLDCVDGSVNFARVECPSESACVFISLECVGSATRLDDGTLLLTSAPTPEGRELDALGLCTGMAGTALPLTRIPWAPEPAVEPSPPSALVPPVRPGDPCERVRERAGSAERQPVALDGASAGRGSETALVTLVEFSDFQCPFCGRVQSTLTRLLEEYDGDVRLVFRHRPLPFHTDAPLAHQATLAAGEQGYFWEMHDLVFSNQRTLDRATLERHASSLGLDLVAFRAYLDGHSGQSIIDADQALAARVGATGTPNFFVNGRQLTGAQPFEAFRDLVEEELAFARELRDEGLTAEQIYACLVE